MKYISVGSEQQLSFSTTKLPQVRQNECLIKVKAIGVNRADILQREGKYPPPAGESPILGLEICGEIVNCGESVSHWQVGQRVFGLVAGGGYAEYAVINADHLFMLPNNLNYQQGAAIAEVFLTAFQSLFKIASLKPLQKVFIHAGASGVGTAAIQLAKSIKCTVVVSVSNESKQKACLELGADVAINYKKQDFVAWKKDNEPKGFDVIVDFVAGDYLNKNIDIAGVDGHIVMLALLGGRLSQPVDALKLLSKRLNISASTLRNRDDQYKSALINDFMEFFGVQLGQQKIVPVIDSVYSWGHVEEAHQRMKDNANIGKLILLVDE